MKKNLCVVLTVLLCGTMLAGCSKQKQIEEKIQEVQTSTTEKSVPDKDKSADVSDSTVEIEEDSAQETTTEETTQNKEKSENSDSSVPAGVSVFDEGYANLGEGKKIDYEKSLTYKIYHDLADSDTMYTSMVKESADGPAYMEVAVNGKDFVIKINSNGVSSLMYIDDMVFTLYDETNMTAKRMTISQEDLDSLGMDKYKSTKDFTDIKSITSYETTIGGRKFTYEFDNSSNTYFVYDENGNFIISTTSDPDSERVIVYALTTSVPSEIWTQPTGYEIQDLSN